MSFLARLKGKNLPEYQGTKTRLCGFLLKESPHSFKLSSPKRRWFSLEGHDMVYYTQPGDTKSLGCINLLLVTSLEKRSEKTFVLFTPKRDWILTANSRQQRDYWVQGLVIALNEIRKSAERQARLGSPAKPKLSHRQLLEAAQENEEDSSDILMRGGLRAIKYQPHKENLPAPSPRTRKRIVCDVTKPDGQLRKKVDALQKEEQALRTLQAEKIKTENEEMRLLLGTMKLPRPMTAELLAQQQEFEAQVTALDKTVSEKEILVNSLNTELRSGTHELGVDWEALRRRRFKRRRNIMGRTVPKFVAQVDDPAFMGTVAALQPPKMKPAPPLPIDLDSLPKAKATRTRSSEGNQTVRTAKNMKPPIYQAPEPPTPPAPVSAKNSLEAPTFPAPTPPSTPPSTPPPARPQNFTRVPLRSLRAPRGPRGSTDGEELKIGSPRTPPRNASPTDTPPPRSPRGNDRDSRSPREPRSPRIFTEQTKCVREEPPESTS